MVSAKCPTTSSTFRYGRMWKKSCRPGTCTRPLRSRERRTMRSRMTGALVHALVLAVVVCAAAAAQRGQPGANAFPGINAMKNPYRMLENWPHLGKVKAGAAIGIIPDGTGGTWIHHRSEPPIIHFNAAGDIVQSFADGMFVQAHGFCRDHDGNFWAGDSGPFTDTPSSAGRGFQMFKFTPEGKVLLTLGKAGVSKAG